MAADPDVVDPDLEPNEKIGSGYDPRSEHWTFKLLCYSLTFYNCPQESWGEIVIHNPPAFPPLHLGLFCCQHFLQVNCHAGSPIFEADCFNLTNQGPINGKVKGTFNPPSPRQKKWERKRVNYKRLRHPTGGPTDLRPHGHLRHCIKITYGILFCGVCVTHWK